MRVPLVAIDAVWLHPEKRHRRDARPQPDLIPALFGSPHDLFCEPGEERSHGWISDDDAQLLGSRLMLYVTCGMKCLVSSALGLL